MVCSGFSGEEIDSDSDSLRVTAGRGTPLERCCFFEGCSSAAGAAALRFIGLLSLLGRFIELAAGKWSLIPLLVEVMACCFAGLRPRVCVLRVSETTGEKVLPRGMSVLDGGEDVADE